MITLWIKKATYEPVDETEVLPNSACQIRLFSPGKETSLKTV